VGTKLKEGTTTTKASIKQKQDSLLLAKLGEAYNAWRSQAKPKALAALKFLGMQ